MAQSISLSHGVPFVKQPPVLELDTIAAMVELAVPEAPPPPEASVSSPHAQTSVGPMTNAAPIARASHALLRRNRKADIAILTAFIVTLGRFTRWRLDLRARLLTAAAEAVVTARSREAEASEVRVAHARALVDRLASLCDEARLLC